MRRRPMCQPDRMHLDEHPAARIGLRTPAEYDLAWMAAMESDPAQVGEHNWAGDPLDPAEVEADLRSRLQGEGFVGADRGLLLVELDGATRIGDVSWRTEQWGPTARSRCPAIGIALLPEFRGRGFGREAQRLLIDFLFERDPMLHRVQSDTAVDNLAEQRALLAIGMVEEGRVRDAEYRDGRHHDHFLYGILRAEWERTRSMR